MANVELAAIFVPVPVYARFGKVAKRKQRPVTECISEALAKYLTEEEAKWENDSTDSLPDSLPRSRR